jgi:hypothetical protein
MVAAALVTIVEMLIRLTLQDHRVDFKTGAQIPAVCILTAMIQTEMLQSPLLRPYAVNLMAAH